MNAFLLLAFFVPSLAWAELRTVRGLTESPPVALGWILPILGCVLVARYNPTRFVLSRFEALAGAAGSLLIATLAPAPGFETGIIAASAFLASAFAPRVAGAAFGAAALLTASLVFSWSPIVLAYIDPARILAAPLAMGLRLLGLDAVATDRGVALAVETIRPLEVGAAIGHLGLREILSLASAAAVLSLAFEPTGRRLRAFAIATGILVVAAIVRWVGFVVWMLAGNGPSILVDPMMRSALLGLPVSLGFAALRFNAQNRENLQPATLRVGPVFAIAVTLMISAMFAEGPVVRAKGRIAVAEAHSRWERLDLPFDRTTFGTRAVYNYSEWMRGLERRFGKVDRLSSRITDRVLEGCSVLLLKTPTEPLLVQEVDAIDRWVRAGGGLYLVGDHTDVFGMGTILNSVGRRFGIEFNFDAVFESHVEGGQVTDPKTFAPHPVVRAMKPMHWMTSCSLSLSPPARAILWAVDGYSDDPDYGSYTFFGDNRLSPVESYGGCIQVAEARPGNGRVLAFTDSTTFSNFSICLPGVQDLALEGVNWLNCRELFPAWRWLALAAGAGLLAWCLRPALAAGGRAIPWLAAGLGLGFGVSEWSVRAAIPAPGVEVTSRDAVFDTTISAGRLPIWHESHAGTPDDFWSMFLAFQRSGEWMRVAMDGDDPLSGSSSIFVWPKAPVDAAFTARMKDYVEKGGRVFIFDDRIAGGSAANSLLQQFGLEMEPRPHGRELSTRKFAASAGSLRLGLSAAVLGGEPLVVDTSGEPIAASVSYGRGSVVAVGIAEDFAVAGLGTPYEVRSERSFDLYQLLYFVMDSSRTIH